MHRSPRAPTITLALLLGSTALAIGQESAQTPRDEQPGGTYETAPAQVTRWGDTGFFDIFSAYTVPRGQFAGAAFRDNIDRSPLNTDISNFIGAFTYGATDKVEIFGRVDFQRRIDTDALHEAFGVTPRPNYNDEPRVNQSWATGFGDIWVGGKYNIFSEWEEGRAVGLAVRGFLKIPAASEDEGLGTGKVSGGAHLVASKTLGEAVGTSYYVGFQGNGSPDDINIGSAFQWGLGVSAPTNRPLRATAQLSGSTFSGNDFDQDSPTDLLLGLTYQTARGVFVTAGWRTNFGFDTPDETASGFNISIGYYPGGGTRGRYIPPPPPAANRPPTVDVTANPAEVEEGADSRVTADANDPDGDPLTYAWRAPDGRITGTGPAVTWTAPTGTEGSFPVTATVDDGRGGTASDTVNIRVHRRVVQAIEFEDVHFLFDRFDLTDEARGILDKVAAALRENSNLNIEIEGHCCSIATEEYNLSLGARRADTVKTYLVRAGIAESRLTTISYGESRPAHDNSREVTRRLNRRAHLRVLVTAPND
jgi:outer membrane protein OmpA-like peptidoglycan-associated protein